MFCWNVLHQGLESLEQRLTGSHHICLVGTAHFCEWWYLRCISSQSRCTSGLVLRPITIYSLSVQVSYLTSFKNIFPVCTAMQIQLYLAFSPTKEGDDAIAIEAMRNCIKELHVWMTRNRLMLNEDKTDFLLIGTRQQLLKVKFTRTTVGSEAIECKESVRNLT